jgi:hypothetical protein
MAVRNVDLYHQVPSVEEYWIIDPGPDPNKPKPIVHQRQGKSWRIKKRRFGKVYTTELLPGFELIVDPRK